MTPLMVPITTDLHCELKQITHMMVLLSDIIVNFDSIFEQLNVLLYLAHSKPCKKTYIVWIFSNFPATLILREINFG